MQGFHIGRYRKIGTLLLLMQLAVVQAKGVERVVFRNSALADYIYQKDSSYRWTINGIEKHSGMDRVIHVDMISQSWQPEGLEVTEPLWHHRMTIYIPEHQSNRMAVLHVNGGTRHPLDGISSPRIADDLDFQALARSTGSIVVDLKDVPNQYLTFAGERPRKEDDLIARTWAAFLQNPRACSNCLLRFPMSKAVVRGMDAVEEILRDPSLTQDGFILTGGSKRGWATWLVSALDDRVKAIVPMVIDVLNTKKSLQYLHDAYGYWIPPLQPYREKGQDTISRLHSPEMEALLKEIDPWEYRDYLTLPKYVITASGDDFFPPDVSRFYWPGLKGKKWMRVYPNSRHYIVRDNAIRVTETVAGFVGAIVTQAASQAASQTNIPDVDDTRLDLNGGSVEITGKPKEARLWQVTNPKARDFRMTTLLPAGLEYKATPLVLDCVTKKGKSHCTVDIHLGKPLKGWTAWFAEFVFDNGPYPDLVFTTPVRVTPDTFPLPR